MVRDLQAALGFYRGVLGLRVIADFGANVTLTGGLSLQTEESWLEFIGRASGDLAYGGNTSELYFETEDFDGFTAGLDGVELVHPPLEHRWGQRVVRLYDPDRHIIEVAEPLGAVVRRFRDAGLTQAETAARMDIPQTMARRLLK